MHVLVIKTLRKLLEESQKESSYPKVFLGEPHKVFVIDSWAMLK